MLDFSLKACSARGLRLLCLVYSTLDGSVAVGDLVKTLSSATPPQRHKSMQVACARARTVADAVEKASRILDLEGDEEDKMAGGQAGDSDTKVLMRRW